VFVTTLVVVVVDLSHFNRTCRLCLLLDQSNMAKKSLNHDLALLANELSRQPAARSLLAASVFVSPSFREF